MRAHRLTDAARQLLAISIACLAGAAAPANAQEAPTAPPPATRRLTRAPELTGFVQAEYPADARARGLEAVVVLSIDVDAIGAVTSVAVVEPAGNGFDEAAAAAARQFRFRPAESNGAAVPVRITYRYHFVLAPPPAPPADAQAPALSPPPEPVNFTGRVIERGTRAPLTGIDILVVDASLRATTDEQGAFRMRGVPPGTHTVRIEMPDYETFEAQERFTEGHVTDATYHVLRHDYEGYEIVVHGTRMRREVTQRTLTMDEVARVPGTYGDAVRVVENLPGVARTPFGSGDLVIWGSAPGESRTFIDGLEVPRIYHFGGLRSIVNPEMVASVDLIPGAYGPQYGEATGGIVDVTTRQQFPERWHGHIAADVIDTSVFIQGPVTDRVALTGAFRRSYLDVTLPALLPDGALTFTTAPVYYDYQLAADFRLARGQSLRIMGLGSDDRLEVVLPDDSPGLRETLSNGSSFHRIVAQYRARLSPGTRLLVQPAVGLDNFAFQAGDRVEGSNIDFDTWSAWLRAEIEHRVARPVTLRAGIDFSADVIDFAAVSPPPPVEGMPQTGMGPPDGPKLEDHGSLTRTTPALYLQADYAPLGDRLHTTLGVRTYLAYDVGYSGTPDEVERATVYVEPRISQRLRVSDALTLFGAMGLFHGELRADEISRGYGNPELLSPRATHYTAGAHIDVTDYFSIEATGFLKLIDRLPVVSPGAYRPGSTEPRLVNDRDGRVYGLELLVKHQTHAGFMGWIAYTLSRSERRDHPGEGWRVFDYDQTHILTAVASYDLGAGWEVGARFRLVTGTPYTPALGGYFDSQTNTYEPIWAPTNSARLGTFHQLDLRIEKRFVFDAWILRAYLDVQNVYLHANEEGMTYNYDFSAEQAQTGIPFLPVIGVRGDL